MAHFSIRTQCAGRAARNFLSLFLLIAAGFAARPAQAQSPATASRKTSTPYTGDLSIFDSPGREDRLQINRVMDILKVAPGSVVADIGAGSGWFSVRAAKRVGKDGEVYAVEINPDAIAHIKGRAAKEGIANLQTVLGTSDDAPLPAGKINAVLLLKTYHEVAAPVALMKNLRKSLAPKAMIGIIDRNGNGEDHGIAEKVVVSEAQQAGYKLVNRYDFVKADGMDYFLIFEVQ
ncbi:MAG: class I SAM-dependent methyltransferase [Acidobacteria bacterium]|nr:class I SAM-dependent methyltransferase [Acidobacteriota bacterium]